MAAKTYIPQLRSLAEHFQRYSTRYQTKLSQNMDDPTYANLLDAQGSMAVLLQSLGPEIIND